MSEEGFTLPNPDAVPLDNIPTILGEIEAFKAHLWRRWTLPPATAPSTERLISALEAAERTGMSVDWLYRHAGELPFTRRIGPRALRFSEAGIVRWLTSRR